MVRIKGANSDYKYVADNPQQPIQEDKKASPLYMELFICPNDMPSKVEPNDGHYCQGTDENCPSQENNGHAKIRLDQKQGIILSVKNTEALRVSDEKIVLQVEPTEKENQSSTKIEITSDEINLKVGQTEICLKSNGDIELKGKVSITGDNGDLILPEATIEKLKTEILQAVLTQINSPASLIR
ncbi:MAG: hypothetical protein AAF349_06375 [Cyanobacteria bacterium P01_A01_bin.68]